LIIIIIFALLLIITLVVPLIIATATGNGWYLLLYLVSWLPSLLILAIIAATAELFEKEDT